MDRPRILRVVSFGERPIRAGEALTEASRREIRWIQAQRSRHQAAAVEHADDVAVLLDAVLVAHRPPHPHGRRPVDLADVVVGEVVADRLELRAEAERAARALARFAEAARAHREREPARRRQVGVDEQLLRFTRLVIPRRQADRAADAQRGRRQLKAPAPAHHQLGLQPPVVLLRGELDLRRRARLADADPARLLGQLDRQRRGDPARHDRRHAPPRPRRAAGEVRVGDQRTDQRGGQHRREQRPDDEREQRDRPQRGGGTGRRAHPAPPTAARARTRGPCAPRRRRRSARARPRAAARSGGRGPLPPARPRRRA